MSIFKHNLARSKRHGLNRHGLSIIEVLTSIVVALIGVFGVLAMIPFSVKQTQSGLDQDAATTMARNVLSNFEASGYKVVFTDRATGVKQLNWIDVDGVNVPTAISPASNPLVCIDPLGITEQGGAFNTFPFNANLPDPSNPTVSLPIPPELQIPTVNLLRPNGTPFETADARRMFRLTDDLVFGESINSLGDDDAELNGPTQLFNEGVGGLLNRQSTGAVSWCAIAQPIINDPDAEDIDSYKFNVLVFKDRITDSTAPESLMRAALVNPPLGPAYAQPLATVEISTALSDDIRRNDWVMLINEERPDGTPVAFRTNLAFARVTNLASLEDIASGQKFSRLTLDGPDFHFAPNATTYIVHLRDVVAVFPRTIQLETISGWNVND